MRRPSLLAGALLMAGSLLVTPAAHAQSQSQTPTQTPQAGGACGPDVGMYMMNNAHAEDFDGGGTTVPALYYRVDYSGLPGPTTIGVISYYNDMQTYRGVSTFSVQDSGGTIQSVIRANTNPAAQGGEGSPAPASGRIDGPATSQRSRGGAGASGYGGGGGLMPGEYIFQVYTGEVQQTPDGPRFNTSPAGYLGEFRCGVQD